LLNVKRMGINGGNSKPFQANCQTNAHDVGEVVNLDDIIDYAVMKHDVGRTEDTEDIKDDAFSDDAPLVYMAGQGTDSSSGDI
jgi:hypothetical protein